MKTSTTYRESVHLLEVRGAVKAIGLLFMAFLFNTTVASAQCTISSTSSAGPTTCGGTTGTITLNGLSANTTYAFNYTKNGVAQTAVNVTTNASGVLVKTALASATYSSIYVTKTGCTSNTVGPITLSDPAAPVISSTASAGPTTCGGSTGTITLNGLLANTSYTFNYSKNGVVQTSSAITSNASGQVIKTALAAATYSNISVTINNCTSATVGPITLSNPAAPSITASNNGPVCQAGTLNLSATTVTGATYSWTGPSGYTSTSQNPSRTNVATTAAGTYSVTATLNNCTSTPATTTVVVNATPATPTTTSNSPVCTGSNILLTASSSTSGVTYSWTGPNSYTSTSQNPTISNVTSTAGGTYSVVAIANGCSSATATRSVTINTTPVISSSSSTNPTTCSGTTGTIVLNGLAASTAYTFNYYKNGVAGASQNITSTASGVVTKTGLGAGTYTSITLTRSSCISSAVGPFTLTDPPAPTASASNNGPICQGTTLALTAATVTGATYRWNGPNAYTTTTQNPTRTNASTTFGGVYTLTVTLSNCVSAPSTTNVTVNPTPVTPIASSNTPVCTGTNLNLTASTTTPGVTYTWTGPNSFTSTTQNPSIASVTTAAGGTYTVKATANGCNSANATTAVTVNTTPAISSSSSTNPSTCGGTNGSITLNGLAASSTFTINYTKNGVAATPTNFNSNASGVLSVTTLSAASYTNITATRNNCTSNTVAGPLTLSDPAAPVISSTGSVNPTTCAATNGSITLNGLLASTTYSVSYTKNGVAITPVNKTSNASGTISLTALSAGIYDNITVTRTSCTSSKVGPIYLSGTPVFTTTYTNPTTCGGSDGVINMNGLIPSATYAVNYKKDGVTQSTLNLTTNSSGIASLTGLVSASYSNLNVTLSGCTSADAATMTLTNPPAPSLTSISGSNPTTCAGNDGSITLGGLSASTAYTVNYSKNGIPQTALPVTSGSDGNIVMSFNAGAYSAFNVTRANCTSNNIGPVTLTDPALPVVTVGSNGPLCVGGTFNLTSSSSIGGVTYSWTGPNGYTSTSQNPTISNVAFTDTGSYTVSATINNCTSNTVSTALVINTPGTPTASNSGPTCEGLPVTFNAGSVSGATYSWSGPNGFTSTSQNPTLSNISLASAGSYSVVATYAGCPSATGTTSLVVNPGFTVAISGTTTLCAGLNTNINFASGPANATVNYTVNGVS